MLAMSKPLFNSIIGVPKQGGVADIARALYAPFLKLKGVSQYAKTVFITIHTNKETLHLHLCLHYANGNIGKGSDIFESVAIVLNDIFKKLTRA